MDWQPVQGVFLPIAHCMLGYALLIPTHLPPPPAVSGLRKWMDENGEPG